MGQLLARHLPQLRAFVRRRAGAMLRAVESDGDIVQSVCREVLQQASGFEFRGDAEFLSWLYTVALRSLTARARYYRRDKRELARQRPVGAGWQRADEVFDPVASSRTPSRLAMTRETIATIDAAFDALPTHYREVVMQSRIFGLSHRQIGERIGRSEVAVQRILTRALTKLSGMLDDLL